MRGVKNGITAAGIISAGERHTVGLRADGKAVAVGWNEDGQCKVHEARLGGDVSSRSDLVAVSAGGFHTVGLRADGTAVAVGMNGFGQCRVSSWRLATPPPRKQRPT